METEGLKIEAPEGYEVDWENSSKNTIRFKPIKKKVTYEDIIQELKAKNIGICVRHGLTTIGSELFITNEKQLEQLLALNKLMNVAEYLNGDWEPDFTNSSERKWWINYDFEDSMLSTDFSCNYRNSVVYFKSEELANQAIEILGEDEVKKALGIFE